MPPTVPNFLVAGAGRAGTTAVVEALRGHPEVFVTMPKEPHYFAFHGRRAAFTGPGDEQWVNRVAVTELSDYLSLYDDGAHRRARGEGSVSTLYYAEHAASEIARVNPEMRVVLLLREPVARAYSSHAYLRLRGVETEPDFARALALEEERRRAGWHHMWHYSAMSRYADSVEILQEALGRDQVGVWFYDDLELDPARVVGEITTFIGADLELMPAPPSVRVNVSGVARSRALQSTIRWATDHEVVRRSVKRVVPFSLRERIRSMSVRPADVSEDVEREFGDRFADELVRLRSLLDVQLPSWLRSSA